MRYDVAVASPEKPATRVVLIVVVGTLVALISFGGLAYRFARMAGMSFGASEPIAVTAQLNHKLQPIDRGERYEHPLHELLTRRGLGKADGGGTLTEKGGEIIYIDVALYLTDLDDSIPLVIRELEARGAPKGSLLRYEEKGKVREIPFGKREGIAVYLDGVNLGDEVYETSDVNVLIDRLNQRLEGIGAVESWWTGPTETALYLYGTTAAELKARIADVLAHEPLCAGARVVAITP